MQRFQNSSTRARYGTCRQFAGKNWLSAMPKIAGKWAMKFIDLSGDSEFESRLEWANYVRILSKHYADALNIILLKYYCMFCVWNKVNSLQSKTLANFWKTEFYKHYFDLKFWYFREAAQIAHVAVR